MSDKTLMLRIILRLTVVIVIGGAASPFFLETSVGRTQMRIQNSVKHLRWSFFAKIVNEF